MAMSQAQRDRFLAAVFNNTAMGITYPLKVRLHTADPGTSGTTAQVDTAVWTNYAAVTVNADLATSPYWTAPASVSGNKRKVENEGVVSFGTAAITGTAPIVTHASVFDSSGTPKFIGKGTLAIAKTINNGDPVSFADGAIVITMDDA